MKKINFLSDAKALTIAIMAVIATAMVSCTSDGLPIPPPETPDTDQIVRLETTMTVNATTTGEKAMAVDALIKLYKSKVGSTGDVLYKLDGGQASIQFKTIREHETAFKQALKNVLSSDVDAVLKLTNATSVELSVSLGNEAIIKYMYKEQVITGTWKCTSGGVDYEIQLTSEKAANGNYIAIYTIDGKRVLGTVAKYNNKYLFESDEKYTENLGLYLSSIEPADATFCMLKVSLTQSPFVHLLEGQIFTK